jgi:hypothetical protein
MMATVELERIAHARSGDKGSASNVGVIARSDAAFRWLIANLTAERVRAALGGIVRGEVVRYELPSLRALNFILNESLGGGGSASLLTDAQGKTHAQALLRCRFEIPESILAELDAARGSESH